MSVALTEQAIMIKGYIDAKDERQRTIYGTFMAAVSRRDIYYLNVMFGVEQIQKEITFDDLRLKLQNQRQPGRDAVFSRCEDELYDFFDASRTLQAVVKSRNAKQAEQAISRFCVENLHLKAVTFLDFAEATDSDISQFASEEKGAEETPPEADTEVEREEPAEKEKSQRDEFVVKCEPILDPVCGVAMTDLKEGDCVCVRLPGDSVFYKLLMKNLDNFDGTINAQVSGFLLNDLGTATVTLGLADDVVGVMKTSGKVKIKAASNLNRFREKRNFSLLSIPVEIVLGATITFVMFCAVALVVYIMS